MKLPQVRVVSGTDPALHQTTACNGWQDHATKVRASEGWKHGPDDKDFGKEWEMVQRIDKGAKKVQDKVWPGDGCKQCVNMSTVDRLDMVESVRLRSKSLFESNETKLELPTSPVYVGGVAKFMSIALTLPTWPLFPH
jgi:hypothetical protein